jgi:cytochrome b6-f complex iron-sulfur subunit
MTTSNTAENTSQESGLSRREMLNLAWLASLGFFFVSFGGVGYLFAMPRFKEGEFGGLITIGSPSSIPVEGSPPDNYPKVKFWLTNTNQGVKALYKVCTHLGCLYSWSDQQEKFLCPCHGSEFEADGTYIRGPAPRDLDAFMIQVVDAQTQEVISETPPDGAPIFIPDDREVIIRVDTGSKILGTSHG